MRSGPTAVICSYRLGMHDGVSVEAAKWHRALAGLGWAVRTVAGDGRADVLLPGLSLQAGGSAPCRERLADAFAGAEVVVVENLCSLPLNPAAGAAVAGALRGRPALMHHHDLALERPTLAHLGPPPDDASWRHVCVSETAAAALASHGIAAEVVRNAFDPAPAPGNRAATRAQIGVAPGERLVLQPTRAIPRKAVPEGLRLAERLGATYWLTGPAEDGYDEELARVLRDARTRVLHRPAPGGDGPEAMAGAYAASDLVVLPSSLEGFGNPAVEAATHRKALAVGSYPVAAELRGLGFTWFNLENRNGIEAFLEAPDESVLDANAAVVRCSLSLEALPARLARLLEDCVPAGLIGRR